MAAKSVSVSLPEAMNWKLGQLEHKYGISKSALIQKGILLLLAEFNAIPFEFGLMGEDVSLEDIEVEYLKSRG